MTEYLDINGDGKIDVHDSIGLMQNQQTFNGGEALKSIVGNALSNTLHTAPFPDTSQRYPFVSGDVVREYIFHKPHGLKDGAPLVVWLHGDGGEVEYWVRYLAITDLADSVGFAVCFPQAKTIGSVLTSKSWVVGYPSQINNPDVDLEQDVVFLDELTRHLQETYKLGDAFLKGFSTGGNMCFRMARAPGVARFKAYSPVSAVDLTINHIGTPEKSPMFFVFGTEDEVWIYTGNPPPGTLSPANGIYPGIEETFEFWCNNNVPNATVTEEALPNVDTEDGSTVISYKCKDGDDSKEVWFYKIVGGIHEIPGSLTLVSNNQDIDAEEEAIKFFQKFNTQTPFDLENMELTSLKRRTPAVLRRKREAFSKLLFR